MLTVASAANADSKITLGLPNFGGNGCPQNTASATLSPDAQQLSILFDQYTVEAMGATTVARKSCNIAIPIHVPNGLSLSIFQVDYRGYNSLPEGASSVLSAEYFFANMQGPKVARTFVGEADDDYYVSDKLLAAAVVWSACGQDVNLRINSSMRVKTNSWGEQALSTVDSIDLSSGMIYHFQFRKCR